MPCPTYEDFMLPMLQFLADGRTVHWREMIPALADMLAMSQADREELLPSGIRTALEDRVGWAKTYVKKAGLIDQPLRGHVRITQVGLQALAKKPSHIDGKFLQSYPGFAEFQQAKKPKKQSDSVEVESAQAEVMTPDEMVQRGYAALRAKLRDEILEQVRGMQPSAFERLVVELMVKMGYGGSFADAAKAVGKSGDGGIDGIIKEDLLGLDTIYLQAKRYAADNPINDHEVRNFIGSLATRKARKGVFITTSSFRDKATEMAKTTEYRLVLIDGSELADLMIDHGLGVSVVQSYNVCRLDSDYFAEL